MTRAVIEVDNKASSLPCYTYIIAEYPNEPIAIDMSDYILYMKKLASPPTPHPPDTRHAHNYYIT